jgi:hypothetical protein
VVLGRDQGKKDFLTPSFRKVLVHSSIVTKEPSR